MSRGPSTGQTPSWRGDARSSRRRESSSNSKWTRAALIGVIMLAVCGTAGGLVWYSWPEKPAVLLTLVNERDGRPTASADRDWLKSQVAQSTVVKSVSSSAPDGETFEASLQALRSSEPLILFVSAPAKLDEGGKVILNPLNSREDLSFDALMKQVRACQASRKLLLIDLYAPPDDSTSGLPRDDIAGALQAQIEGLKDRSIWILCSARAGESSRESEALRRSVFADSVARALGENAADADRAGNHDRFVTLNEFADYVGARVDDWSQVHFGDHQRPTLKAAGDPRGFVVAKVGSAVAKEVEAKGKAAAEKSKLGLAAAAATTKTAAVAQTPVAVAGYPSRLKAGWELHDRWRRRRFYEVAPRPYRLLESALLDSENAWRFGRTAGEVEDRLKSVLDQAQKDEREWAVTREGALPTPVSLAAAQEAGSEPDETLNEAVLELVAQIGRKKPEELTASWESLAAKFPATDREKTFDLAYAVISAARASGSRLAPRPERLRRLASWIHAVHPEPLFVETAALDWIAAVAAQWPDETIREALELTCDGEFLDARPHALALFGPKIREAAALRHDAEVLLQSKGFVPETTAISRVKTALDATNAIRVAYSPIERAERSTQAGLISLIEAAPYVAASDAQSLADWKGAMAQTVAMKKRLAAGENPNFSDNETLENTLSGILSNFDAKAIADRIRESHDGDRARSREFKALDRLLATARPTLTERLALIDAARSLGGRLDEEHRGHLFLSSESASTEDPEATADPRREIARTLLELSGGTPPEEETAPSAAYRERWRKLVQGLPDSTKTSVDTLARILPLWLRSGVLDNRDTSPMWRSRRAELDSYLYRMAERYEFEANDLGSSAFTRDTAEVFRRLDAGPPPHFEWDLGVPIHLGRQGKASGTLKLTPSNLPKARTAESVRLLKPNDPRLSVALVSRNVAAGSAKNENAEKLDAVPLPGEVEISAAWKAEASADSTPGQRPLGVLVQVEWAGRVYSKRVPIEGIPSGVEPEVLLTGVGAVAEPAPATLKLRPLQTSQAFPLSLRNPSAAERTMIVEVSAAGTTRRSAPIVVAPGSVVPVKLEAAAGAPATATELTGPIVIRTLDETGKTELNRQEMAVTVRSPAEYATVVAGTAKYYPKSPTNPQRNRLQVQVRPHSLRPGEPPSIVTLTLPEDSIDPAHAPKEFQPSVALDPAIPGGVVLFAEDFALKEGVSTDCVFYVGVDHDPRVFKFRVDLARGGAERLATLDNNPAILPLNVPSFVDADAITPLDVEIQVDNAPIGAVLNLSMSRTGVNGKLVVDKTETLPGLKRGAVHFTVDPTSGLVFDCSTSEPRWPLKLAGRGLRVLRAELFEAGLAPRKLAEQEKQIILDNQAPRDLQFVKPLPSIPLGANQVQIAATGRADSGIASVNFFLGKPPEKTGDKPAGELVPATFDTARRNWSASVPLAGTERGQFDLSVQFKNGIGRVAYQTTKLGVESTAMKPAQTGTITGVVMYRFTLSNQEVVLLKKAGGEVAKTKSDANGKFVFSDVPPGAYTVSSTKLESFLVKGTKDVNVVAGKSADVMLELSR